jgi:cell division protein FtsQ
VPKKTKDQQTRLLWEDQDELSYVPTTSDAAPKSKPKTRRKIHVFPLLVRMTLASFALLGLLLLTAGFFQLDRYLSSHVDFTLAMSPNEGDDSPNIELKNIEHTDRRTLMRLFEKDFGKSVYYVPLAERQRQINELAWVKSATVQRIWPNRLRISLVERTPVAFVRLDARRQDGHTHVALIDEDGEMMPMLKGMKYDLPVLTGIQSTELVHSRRQQVHRAMKFLQEIGPLANEMSEIDSSDPYDLKVMRRMGNTVIAFALRDGRYRERLEKFDSVYAKNSDFRQDQRGFRAGLDEVIAAPVEEILGQ